MPRRSPTARAAMAIGCGPGRLPSKPRSPARPPILATRQAADDPCGTRDARWGHALGAASWLGYRARRKPRRRCRGQDLRGRRHPRRRDRQGSRAGRQARARGRGAPLRLCARMAALRLELRALRQDRRDDAEGRARADQGHGRHLPRRGRISRRARPRLVVGIADPDPPQLPAICQSAAGAAARRRRIAAQGPKPGDIDFYVVRENNEGEYSEIGGRLYGGTEYEMAMQQSVFTRRGVDRVMRYAFELAKTRKKHVTSATKSNGIIHTMPYWDERFAAVAADYPDVATDQYHIDILTAHFVRHPDWFDVVVGSILFGDILSDLGPACVGSIGIAPSANINPEREHPSMFEPVHGSAPDIAGRGIANPIGQIWSGAMMLEHLGESAAASDIERAIERVLAEAGPRTPDLGGNAGTRDLAQAVVDALG